MEGYERSRKSTHKIQVVFARAKRMPAAFGNALCNVFDDEFIAPCMPGDSERSAQTYFKRALHFGGNGV